VHNWVHFKLGAKCSRQVVKSGDLVVDLTIHHKRRKTCPNLKSIRRRAPSLRASQAVLCYRHRHASSYPGGPRTQHEHQPDLHFPRHGGRQLCQRTAQPCPRRRPRTEIPRCCGTATAVGGFGVNAGAASPPTSSPDLEQRRSEEEELEPRCSPRFFSLRPLRLCVKVLVLPCPTVRQAWKHETHISHSASPKKSP
jgi:hypothetical protein